MGQRREGMMSKVGGTEEGGDDGKGGRDREEIWFYSLGQNIS